jgi:hypothetical protein
MPKNFDDILLEVFDTKKENDVVELDEAIEIPSLIAATAFKKKALEKIGDVGKKAKETAKKAAKTGTEARAKGQAAKEKARAKAGKTTGEDVYKLQKEQKDFLADLYNKYGKELVNEIMDFRREILPHYNLLKRKTAESQQVSAKDKLGMTKRQWERAVETGRSKIKKRAKFGENIDKIKRSIENERNRIKEYSELKRMVSKRELTQQEKEKILNKFDTLVRHYPDILEKAKYPGDTKASQVEKYYSDINNAFNKVDSLLKKASDITEKMDNADEEQREELEDKRNQLIQQAKKQYKNYINQLTGKYEKDLEVSSDYDAEMMYAIQQHLFRGAVRKKLASKEPNIFKEMYQTMLSDFIQDYSNMVSNRKKQLEQERDKIEFNDLEKKVWRKKKSAPDLSSDPDDYELKIKEEDFEKFGGEEKIEQSKEAKEARENINKAIKDFKEDLKKKLDEEDYKKLQKYKLLQTIKLKELEDPKNLFKDKESVQKTLSAPPDEGEEDNEDEEDT